MAQPQHLTRRTMKLMDLLPQRLQKKGRAGPASSKGRRPGPASKAKQQKDDSATADDDDVNGDEDDDDEDDKKTKKTTPKKGKRGRPAARPKTKGIKKKPVKTTSRVAAMKKKQESESEDEDYEVESIVGVQDTRGLEFLVKWVGYTRPTWEPAKNCEECSDKVQQFMSKVNKKIK